MYYERWVKSQIDLLELVTLREAGWTMQAIGERFGVARTTVLRRLRHAYSVRRRIAHANS